MEYIHYQWNQAGTLFAPTVLSRNEFSMTMILVARLVCNDHRQGYHYWTLASYLSNIACSATSSWYLRKLRFAEYARC